MIRSPNGIIINKNWLLNGIKSIIICPSFWLFVVEDITLFETDFIAASDTN